MRGYNQYSESGSLKRGASFFRFLLKMVLVLVFCLSAYVWVQRKNIAAAVIQSQLRKLDVHDLDFTVAELSPYRFELRDVSWGEAQKPFLYVSSVKIRYTPQGLYAGRVDKVSVGGLESSLMLDAENRPHSELLDRVQLVTERVKQLYPPGAGAAQRTLVLPEFELERGTVNVQGSKGFPVEGHVRLDARLGRLAGGANVQGRFALAEGRNASFQGRIELPALDLSSSLVAGITASVDLSGVVDAAIGLEQKKVDLTGELFVKGFKKGVPEWSLKLQIPKQSYRASNELFSLSANLAGESEFHGSITNFSAGGGLTLSNLFCEIKGTAERPAISNGAEEVSLGLELPLTGIDQLSSAQIEGSFDAGGIYSQCDDLIDFSDGSVRLDFSVSAEHGVQSPGPCTYFPHFYVMGSEVHEGQIYFSMSNNLVRAQTSIMMDDEPLRVLLDAMVPLADPQSGTLKIDLPLTKIDSSGRFGKLARRKLGKDFNFGGELGAYAFVDGLHPGAAVTGMVRLVNGSCRNEKAELSGIEAAVPLRFADGAFRSTGEPVVAIESLQAGNIRMGPGKILFHLSERELFVERVQMAWAKGTLHAYAIHAGFDGNIRNEFTVYADKVDLGEVFMLVMPFDGEMEGILYGRFPVLLKKKRVELSGGYLYSLPDQGGRLKLNDPAQMEALLSRAGITDDREKSLSHALSDLDLTAIRLDLEPRAGGDSSLRIKLHGKSNYVKRPAPVNLNLNLNGQLQQLLDLGLDLQRF